MTMWTAADIPDQTGRTVLVTGANSGLGLRSAEALAAKGARVMLGARRGDRLAALCDEIYGAGGVAEYRVTDLRQATQVTALIDAAVESFGHIEALVNNAAYGVVSWHTPTPSRALP